MADQDTARYSFCSVQEKCASLAEPYTTDSTGDVTLDDSQRRFLVQHSVAMLEQCCNYSKQYRNNVSPLCCAKNRRCESSRETSPMNVQ